MWRDFSFQKSDLISYSCSSQVKCFFSPSFQLSFMILIQSLISAIEYDVLRSAYFAIYPVWCALSLLNLWLVSVIDYGKFSAILTSNIFLLCFLFSFSDILIMHRPYFLKFSYHSWMFCFFFFNYYYFFCLHFTLATFYWPLFTLTDFCLGCAYSVDEPDLDIFHSFFTMFLFSSIFGSLKKMHLSAYITVDGKYRLPVNEECYGHQASRSWPYCTPWGNFGWRKVDPGPR